MPDITEDARSILAALTDNTLFPEPLSGKFTVADAYRVQFELLRQREAAGDAHVGWKVGLTSKAMQDQQGVHEPCLGHLVASGHLASPARLAFDDLMAPGFENELCIRIGRPVSSTPDTAEVTAAIDAVAPAIEVVEKRGAFSSDLPLSFAGNAQQRAFVTGAFVPFAPGTDLSRTEVEIVVNGESRERARGAEVLGNPVNSVIWLAGKLAEHGAALKPGDLVMSGSFTRQYAAGKGDRVRAVFSGFGAVEMEFGG